MLKIEFKSSLAKEYSKPNYNEDFFAYKQSLKRLALSDGASESFDSKRWAQLLVKGYLTNPSFGEDWISNLITTYHVQSNLKSLSWSQQAAFDKGSFATLLGFEFNHLRQDLEIISIGDSLIVHIQRAKLLKSFPFQASQSFEKRPELLSTVATNNDFIKIAEFYQQHVTTWKIFNDSTILLMTDALGQWFLRSIELANDEWQQLLSIKKSEIFASFILSLRKAKAIKVDDTSLIRLSFKTKK